MSPSDPRRVFTRAILRWSAGNARSFPWRETREPFAVLVAELLLQKTASYKVIRIYEPFLRRYPSPGALANADPDEVRALLAPLGLPRRAQRLIELGRLLEDSHGGKVPRQHARLLALPGVGPYTANAVQCFAFGGRRPLVDEVVARVYRRFFGLPTAKRAYEDVGLWNFVEGLLPRHRARDFSLAVLDFASGVCTFKRPKCESCLLRGRCLSRLSSSESLRND